MSLLGSPAIAIWWRCRYEDVRESENQRELAHLPVEQEVLREVDLD